jgi:HEPN domain-containing protein
MAMNWRQMASAFLREAQADLNVAEMLLAKKEFANSVEHSQQAVEEIIKSALFLKNISVTNNHFVAEIFEKNFSEHPAAKEIVAKARSLEREGNRSQYPTWDRIKRAVISPSKKYGRETAQKFYHDAAWIFHQIASHLKQAYQITLPDA